MDKKISNNKMTALTQLTKQGSRSFHTKSASTIIARALGSLY